MKPENILKRNDGRLTAVQLPVSAVSDGARCSRMSMLMMSFMVTSAFCWNIGSMFSKPRPDSATPTVGIFFDETYAGNGYHYAYPESSKVSIVRGDAKRGKASVRFWLAADDYSGGSICLNDKVLVLRPFLKTGALQFWIRGAAGNEKAWVALVDDEKADGRKTVVRLPIDWFGGVKADWSLISIPLEHFGLQGVYWDKAESREVDNAFDWDNVAEFRIESKKGENTLFDVQVDDVFIVKLSR